MPHPQEDLAALAMVTTRLVQSIRSIESHQWSAATPCSEWDVTALIEHVTGGNWFTVSVLAGEVEVTDEGRPTEIHIDWEADAIDDEACYEITGYRAGN